MANLLSSVMAAANQAQQQYMPSLPSKSSTEHQTPEQKALITLLTQSANDYNPKAIESMAQQAANAGVSLNVIAAAYQKANSAPADKRIKREVIGAMFPGAEQQTTISPEIQATLSPYLPKTAQTQSMPTDVQAQAQPQAQEQLQESTITAIPQVSSQIVQQSRTAQQDTTSQTARTQYVDEDATRHTRLSALMKLVFGLDIGEDPKRNALWYQTYESYIQQGKTPYEARTQTTLDMRYSPSGVQNILVDMPEDEKNVHFQRDFENALNDSVLTAALAQQYPQIVDPQSNQPILTALSAVILSKMVQSGMYVPKDYLKYVDMARGIAQTGSKYSAEEQSISSYLFNQSNPELLAPSQHALLQNESERREIWQEVNTAVERQKGLYAVAPQAPAPTGYQAAGVETIGEIPISQKREPSENERKTYENHLSVLAELQALEKLAFGVDGSMNNPKPDGVFTGVGNASWQRVKARVELLSANFQGTPKGQNAILYAKRLKQVATLVRGIVEPGGRGFTEPDVLAALQSLPNFIGYTMDSQETAIRALSDAINITKAKMKRIEAETLIGGAGKIKKSDERSDKDTSAESLMEIESDGIIYYSTDKGITWQSKPKSK